MEKRNVVSILLVAGLFVFVVLQSFEPRAPLNFNDISGAPIAGQTCTCPLKVTDYNSQTIVEDCANHLATNKVCGSSTKHCTLYQLFSNPEIPPKAIMTASCVSNTKEKCGCPKNPQEAIIINGCPTESNACASNTCTVGVYDTKGHLIGSSIRVLDCGVSSR